MTKAGEYVHWTMGKPVWAGRAARPIQVVRSRFEMPSGGVDEFVQILPFAAWLALSVVSLAEGLVHAVLVNPARRMFSTSARQAGWTFEATHSAPADPARGPTPRRLTITTLRSPSRATSYQVRAVLQTGLRAETTWDHPMVQSLLVDSGTVITGTRVTYAS